MPWDIWALLMIAILCGSVILWSWWGFHSESHPTDAAHLRLSIVGGGYLDVPRQSSHPPGRHRRMPTRAEYPHRLARRPLG